MRIAACSILLALTFIAVTLLNRPTHVEPLHLTPPPPARNNITFHPSPPPLPYKPASSAINVIIVDL